MQDIESLLPAEIKGKLSIDRVTFLVFSPRLSSWASDQKEIRINEKRIDKMSDFVESQLKDVLDADFPQGVPSELFLHHFRTTDGIDIQLGSIMPKRKKVSDESLIMAFGSLEDQKNGYMYRYSPNDYAFRVEFNPNNTSLDSIRPVLEFFRYYHQNVADLIRIARIDIAIDYDTAISPGLVLCKSMRKGFSAYGTGGLESLYFGSRQSKYMFRLYNKRQEQIDKGEPDLGFDRWRLELESKDSFFLTGSLPDFRKIFERVSFVDGAESSGDWVLDLVRQQAVTYGLESVLRSMPRATAKRYRKIFLDREYRKIEPPFSAFDRLFDLEMQKLRVTILRAFGYEVTLT